MLEGWETEEEGSPKECPKGFLAQVLQLALQHDECMLSRFQGVVRKVLAFVVDVGVVDGDDFRTRSVFGVCATHVAWCIVECAPDPGR